MFDSFFDQMVDEIRRRVNEPDADLAFEIWQLNCALKCKVEYKEEVDNDHRKELWSLKKKIKKKEAEILKKKMEKKEAKFRKRAGS